MNRNEMVELMIGHFKGGYNFKSDKELFSYILSRMEEAGMSPAMYTYISNGKQHTIRAWEDVDEIPEYAYCSILEWDKALKKVIKKHRS